MKNNIRYLSHVISALVLIFLWRNLYENQMILSDIYIFGNLFIVCVFWLAWTIERMNK